ncbi:hypothetical protein D3C78_980450 [compost metagenome]
MGAGLQETKPQHGPRNDVGVSRADTDPLEGENHQDADAGDQQSGLIEPAAVEHRDDQHRDDVIDDGQRQQENTHVTGDGAAQQGEYADGECDIGGRWNGPALPRHRLAIQREINQRGNHDTTEGGNDRQRGQPPAGQGSLVDLTANLHAHDQEEYGHQGIVDPEVQRLGNDVTAQAKRQGRMPQRVVAIGGR